MEAKKISFGFSKINKNLKLLPTKDNAKSEAKVELIKCLEGQEIKLVEEIPEKQPLLIPLRGECKTSSALASLMKRRAVLLGEEEPQENNILLKDPSTSTINQGPEDIETRAVRELLVEGQSNSFSDQASKLVLPVVKPDDLPLEGASESTLDDYESIPIQDFGKAMLRGMGWTEPLPKPNKKAGLPSDDTPMTRPKGMGLGADKALSKRTLLVAPEANEILEIKRNAYVIILGGKYKDLYGQIEGFDDHGCRVIVRMAIGGAKEAFNEFLCQPVSKRQYAQYGKCINSSKYEEYKKNENEYGQIILNKDLEVKIEKNIKQDHHNSFEDKHNKTSSNVGRGEQKDYRDDKKNVKTESSYYREERNSNNDNIRNKDDNRKESSRNEYQNQKNEANRDDRERRRKYDDRDKKEYNKDDDNYRQRDYDRYELKSDYKNSQMSKKHDHDYKSHTSSRDYDRSNESRDKQRHLDRDSYAERVVRSEHKSFELHDSSDTESDSYSTKHRKLKKANFKKKTKKSKKNKSKYKSDSSDTNEASTSTENSSSDSEQEKYKRHKKKTKKSKKQRERSRSRGRR